MLLEKIPHLFKLFRANPWYRNPVCAIVDLDDELDGWGMLIYINPHTGDRMALPITRGPHSEQDEKRPKTWSIQISDDERTCITEPSILVYDPYYHSPYTTFWRIVDIDNLEIAQNSMR